MKKATDIVLLMPGEIDELSKDLNMELDPETKVVDFDKSLPHLSLSMGVIDDSQLDEVSSLIQKISENFSEKFENLGELIIHEAIESPIGKNIFLNFEKSKWLQELHEEIIDKLDPIYKDNLPEDEQVTEDMFFDKKFYNDFDPNWVKGFSQNASFENFKPHITIGKGWASSAETLDLPIIFKVKSIAICHLGSYCTCAKILQKISIPTSI